MPGRRVPELLLQRLDRLDLGKNLFWACQKRMRNHLFLLGERIQCSEVLLKHFWRKESAISGRLPARRRNRTVRMHASGAELWRDTGLLHGTDWNRKLPAEMEEFHKVLVRLRVYLQIVVRGDKLHQIVPTPSMLDSADELSIFGATSHQQIASAFLQLAARDAGTKGEAVFLLQNLELEQLLQASLILCKNRYGIAVI